MHCYLRSCKMRKWFQCILLLIILSLLSNADNDKNYKFKGKSVYVNDTSIYLGFAPYNFSIGKTNLTVIPSFSGNMSIGFVFDQDVFQIKSVNYFLDVNVSCNETHSNDYLGVKSIVDSVDDCDWGFEYNKFKKLITFEMMSLNGSVLEVNETSCFDSLTDHGDGYFTARSNEYRMCHLDRLDLSNRVIKEYYKNKKDMVLYYIKEFTVASGEEYVFEFNFITSPSKKKKGKFDVVVWPVEYGSDIEAAKKNNVLYSIDPWYSSEWNYRRTIILNRSISASTESNYQVDVVVDTATLISEGKMQSDCDDAIFTNANNVTLDFWLEPNTCNTGSTRFWVEVDNLYAGNTTIYFYYGNNLSSSMSSVDDTFYDNLDNVIAVWHFDEGSGNWAADATGQGRNARLINRTTWVTGKYDSAIDFDGTASSPDGGFGEVINQSVFKFTSDFTVAGWFNPDTVLCSSCALNFVGKIYFSSPAGFHFYYRERYFGVEFRIGGNWNGRYTTTTPLVTDKWQHLVYSYNDGGNSVDLYYNGTLQSATGTINDGEVVNNYPPFLIGRKKYEAPNWDFADDTRDEMIVTGDKVTSTEAQNLYLYHIYTTPNYQQHALLKKYDSNTHPDVSIGSEESIPSETRCIHDSEDYVYTSDAICEVLGISGGVNVTVSTSVSLNITNSLYITDGKLIVFGDLVM